MIRLICRLFYANVCFRLTEWTERLAASGPDLVARYRQIWLAPVIRRRQG